MDENKRKFLGKLKVETQENIWRLEVKRKHLERNQFIAKGGEMDKILAGLTLTKRMIRAEKERIEVINTILEENK